MSDRDSGVLNQMLERLFAAIVRGPGIDCRPANSRQRLDLTELSALDDLDPAAVIQQLLGAQGSARIKGCVKRPAPVSTEPPSGPQPTTGAPFAQPGTGEATTPGEPDESDTERARKEKAWARQQAVIRKLRHIAEEARTYEEDTGVYVLNVGFPLLHIPKHANDGGPRVLAPIAFIPVKLAVSTGASPSVDLTCRYSGEDRLIPNESLLAWIERQTGKASDELFSDEEGDDPWRELKDITGHVCAALEMEPPAWVSACESDPDADAAATPLSGLDPAPRRDDDEPTPGVRASAVLGLYPVSNQSLLRDTQQMIGGGESSEPLASFLTVETDALAPDEPDDASEIERRKRTFTDERFIQLADPCQSRAVRLAREVRGLVIHGPPGTGKSQTIANIIGDHLARAERVLFVCDKRTALDVVANRLSHIGLGDLCALIHDAKRDQRDLYMSVRSQLEGLTDTFPQARADKRITSIDKQLQTLHDELLETWRSLMLDPEDAVDAGIPDPERAGQEGSFHDLVGRWLAIDSAVELPSEHATGLNSEDLVAAELDINSVLQRGLDIEYGVNPWPAAAGLSLDEFLAAPADEFRSRLEACGSAASSADALIRPHLAPFDIERDHESQARAIAELADELESVSARTPEAVRRRWAGADPSALQQVESVLSSAAPMSRVLASARPDPEIDIVLNDENPTPGALAQDLSALAGYEAVATRWWSFAAIGVKKKASRVTRRYGFTLDPDSAARVGEALKKFKAMLVVKAALDQVEAAPPSTNPVDFVDCFDAHAAVVGLLSASRTAEIPTDCSSAITAAMAGARPAREVVEMLRAAPARAEAITRLHRALGDANLFSQTWIQSQLAAMYRHDPAEPVVESLASRFGDLEEVLRIEDTIQRLPASLTPAVRALLNKGADPERGMASLTRAMLGAQIGHLLASTESLQRLDGRRIESALSRMGDLQQEKMALVRAAIASRWLERQRERLLVGTGSRLNSLGAEVRRRLLTRGRRAMRLRQVVRHGRSIEGGDPLFDLRPVWMASPETVAQIFPRDQMFDVVIFDEASQCRLEEALPVLTRAKRVVVAGDPKQLPPSRFFESSIVASDQREIDSDQDLFELQQGEVEDLLGAALNLEIEHAYLDVHYRSRNADLIEFSNREFYGSRLQAIPGHPSNRTQFAPLQLTHAGGIYADGQNPVEADRVVQVVHDLLRRAAPPSIGIACFNVAQRDLIIDKLDDAAEQDADFARRLARARSRTGEGSFEGLFVKNLENVQGDERDHIIISTTYGPNDEGRFYRRFGPLIQAGGGRRLNVLVTRAREEVHLVTSIPPDQYRALPPVPEGQAPGGAWLLFAYLNYAERLADLYELAHAEREQAHNAPDGAVRTGSSDSPSTLAESLAGALASRGQCSEVYWGNDGFCVDVALDHPVRADDVTIGIQTDMTRFRGAADPVEWEAFRTAILESQGWALHRTWSPTIFRDLSGVTQSAENKVRELLSHDQDPDAIRTWRLDAPSE